MADTDVLLVVNDSDAGGEPLNIDTEVLREEGTTNLVKLKAEPEVFQEFDPAFYVSTSLTPEPEVVPTGAENSDPRSESERSDIELGTEEPNAHSPILVEKDAEQEQKDSEAENVETKVDITYIDMEDVVTLTGRPILEYVLEMRRGLDTVITLKDGKLGAHRMVLTAASPFLGEMLTEQNSKGKATLVIPDVTMRTMERLLNLAYTGRMYYSQEEAEDVYAAMKLLYFAEFANLSLVKVKKRNKPSCSFQVQGFLGPIPEPEVIEAAQSASSSIVEVPVAVPNNGNRFSCTFCNKTFAFPIKLHSHIDHVHASVIAKVPFEDIQKLTYCNICNVQWKTLERSQTHFHTKHDSTCCWICLEPVSRKELKSHYFSFHREVPDGSPSDFTVKCRWCPRITSLRSNSNCNAINSHGHAHMPPLPTSKKGGKNSPQGNGFNFKVPVGRPPKSRTRADKANERILGRVCEMPSNYLVDEVTKKCRIDLNNLPCISIPLERLSHTSLMKLSSSHKRPDASGVGTSTSATQQIGASTSTTSTPVASNVDPGSHAPSDKLLSIDPIFEAQMKNFADEIFPEHFLFATESTEKVQSPEAPLAISVDVPAKPRKRRSAVPVDLILSLFTEDWGQMNLSVYDMSESLLKANYVPKEGYLLIGRVSPDFLWTKIDNMHNTMSVTILRLIPNSGDEENYASLHEHLTTTKRTGVLSGTYPSDVADSYIFALNTEDYNRQSLVRFHGPDFSELAGHAKSLLMVVIRHASVSAGPKRGRKSKKVSAGGVKSDNATTTGINDEKLLGAAQVQAGTGTLRTDPEILVELEKPPVLERNPVPTTPSDLSLSPERSPPVLLDEPSDPIRQMYKRILRPQENHLEQVESKEAGDPTTPVVEALSCATPTPAAIPSIRGRSKRLSTASTGGDPCTGTKRKPNEEKKRNSPRWKQTKLSFSNPSDRKSETQSAES